MTTCRLVSVNWWSEFHQDSLFLCSREINHSSTSTLNFSLGIFSEMHIPLQCRITESLDRVNCHQKKTFKKCWKHSSSWLLWIGTGDISIWKYLHPLVFSVIWNKTLKISDNNFVKFTNFSVCLVSRNFTMSVCHFEVIDFLRIMIMLDHVKQSPACH